MKGTKTLLVTDLKEALKRRNLTPFQREKIEQMIEWAKEGYYHDFESELATPKMQLHIDLSEVGLTAIDKKMIKGDYDDNPTELN